MRISVVGLAGSGNTTLADAISKKLSIPHIHLDRFWFEANGLEVYGKGSGGDREAVRASVRQKVLPAIAANEWVSDGLYLHVQPEIAERADTVVFLDIPLWRRLLSHIKRSMSPSKRHAELNVLNEISFFFEIIRREFKTKPKLRRFVAEHKDKVIVLKSRKAVQEFLDCV